MPTWTETAAAYLRENSGERRAARSEVRRIEGTRGQHSIAAAKALDEAAGVDLNRGRSIRAEAMWRRSAAIKEQHAVPDPCDLALTLTRLARIVEDRAEAEVLFRRAVSLYEAAPDPDRVGLAAALNAFGRFLDRSRRSEAAEPLLRRSCNLYQAEYGRADRRLVDPMIDLASALLELAREDEAERILRRAKIIYENAEGPSPYNRALTLLISLLNRQSRHREAVTLAEGLRFPEPPRLP